MAQITRASHKDRFQTGDIPTQADYVNLIDSFAILTNDHNSGSFTLTGSMKISSSVGGSVQIATSTNLYALGGIVVTPGVSSLALNLTGNSEFNGNITSSAGSDISGSSTGTLTYGTIDASAFTSINSTSHITASGNISSSGNIISNTGIFSSHITSSGNISSSGTIIADNFTSDGGDVGGISFTDGVNITGNITASGDISGSNTSTIRTKTLDSTHQYIDFGGTIVARGNTGGAAENDEFFLRNYQGLAGYYVGVDHADDRANAYPDSKTPQMEIYGRYIKLKTSHSTTYGDSDNQKIQLDSGEDIEMDAYTGLYTFKHDGNNLIAFNKGHISSSGNISASGTTDTTQYLIEGNKFSSLKSGTTDVFNIGNAGAASLNLTHITASGDISGSTALIVENVSSSGEIEGRYKRPIITKSSDGALILNDKGSYLRCGANTLTIPLNSAVAFPIGTEIDFIQTAASGHLLITASAGQAVTINTRHDLYSASGQWSAVSIKKVGTDEWDMLGDLTK